jgi:hypothetical protein
MIRDDNGMKREEKKNEVFMNQSGRDMRRWLAFAFAFTFLLLGCS